MATSRPLITIIGSLNIDFVTTTPRCPTAGETLTATSLDISAGGKGANQAVGCGKASFTSPGTQNVQVEMIGAVGEGDVYVQKLLMPTLREGGVGVSGIKECSGSQTGTASIVLESDTGQNRIMVVPGANHQGMSEVDEVLNRSTKDGRDPDVVVMQGEIPRSTVLGLLKHFNQKDKKTQVVFNPAPVYPEGIPLESLTGTGVLIVNETETIMLGHSLREHGLDMTGVDSDQDLQDETKLDALTKQFHDITKINTILITLGARGSFFSDMATGRKGLVPAIRVPEVVDTTAAGDTFVGYLAVALARHLASATEEHFDVESALKRANQAAAICVQRVGAMQSIPYGYE